jgi:hypothetical protein
MHAAADRRVATKSWREWAAELRQVAATTRDPALRQRYRELADRWEEEASDEEPQPRRRRFG